MSWQRFLSRKFLVALGTVIGAVVASLVTPATGDTVADAVVKLGAIAAAVLAALGYIKAEASIDRADRETAGKLADAEMMADQRRAVEAMSGEGGDARED